jgi:hypothetical protein
MVLPMETMKEGQRSDAGNDFKSRAEEQIARLLDKRGIAYRHEYPRAVIDRAKTRIWYPDFYLPEYGMIIEYFGINGDSNYNERSRHKKQVYKKAGIEGLFLKSDSMKGDWPSRVIGQIEDILKNRLDKFYNRAGSKYK